MSSTADAALTAGPARAPFREPAAERAQSAHPSDSRGGHEHEQAACSTFALPLGFPGRARMTGRE